ncbi:hypothetical protein Cst_c23710 [Thermoclostridium stercorarium subsp. stercorarium DSM 8532]|jgi:lysophospholipase L1-like esterase|uniref:SGNH hydrolase-type esterase domain-containing protein n=3 Tax=Thermoclostridium stercorarium TaxID=1510 RepID=L7VSI1_THES1|nr:SGNH/GDSL hydrolase family protein [Thermoclostridium stercorarium]AGC69331.1 hypothetical protein Cst_c23710 [Thermoclostridium stercorarium subsp. stercorarium DSM 8532]AGI40296.1 hypothetical protein Clst_2273 [Thermoclostridium stercorarium subsp. stercorarium DSM 8532]ANW99593.1 hypothetical protein CSTERTH_11395 [Thermoclostridium stercorarium subsp. thermolacticum DSM 2910]ANX02220.1 hypothetical protein CSTERLE_11895 [Thermoclostridium stercorarium subsp. leptospartum DSM 9219]UZQ85
MKIYKITDPPIKIYGLNVIDPDNGNFWRLTPDIMEKMPQYNIVGKRCIGGRVRFVTDSATITIRMELKTLNVDRAIPLPGSAGADVYFGTGIQSRFAGYVAPTNYNETDKTVETKLVKSSKPETVTINLPRNEQIASMEIGIDDGANIYQAAEYRVNSPIIYYGSSITEGGCAPRPGTAYTSILSRWLDADYFNYGFSGGAKGELVFAEYIAKHKNISVFVYDYDHNAPTPEHLANTHEPFFKVIREAHPDIPIVMMSRPDFDRDPKDSIERRNIIYQTYINAKKSGDNNVYFVDGMQFFGPVGRSECTIDGCHPNALGFMRMAETLYPLMSHLLRDYR